MSNSKVLTALAEEKTVPVLHYHGEQEITEAAIPEGTEVVGAKAFSGCANLRVLRLPRSLTNIDMKAFEQCPLEEIWYAGSRRDWARVEISPQGSAPLTAARMHFALAEEDASPALPPREDHREEIFQRIRSLLTGGGDGRLHIVAPDLCVEGVLAKTGDLSMVIFPRGSVMLIDTGYSANISKVMDFLEGAGLTVVHYMAFSHADGDHVANARAIGDYLYGKGGRIERFLWTGQQFGTVVPAFEEFLAEKGCELDLEVLEGRRFTVDGVDIEVLGPTREEILMDAQDGETRNSQSMILRFVYGAASYLTSGDLYAAQESVVVRRWGEKLRADVMKTNHHGCFTSNTGGWLAAVSPRIAFSCNNDNGSTELMKKMAAMGADYCSTGCQGTVLISAGRDGTYEVLTQYGREMRCTQRINS